MSFLSGLFGKRKKVQLADYSALAADMHSHLIPGIDDGSKSFEESIDLIKGLRALGYRKLVTTPHIITGGFDNGPHNIQPRLDELRQMIRDQQIDVELEAAAEYYLDDFFLERIGKEALMSFGNNLLLFELPFAFKPSFTNSAVFKLNSSGYRPILAHPERYTYMHAKTLSNYTEMKNLGLYFQVNISSIIGVYGPEVARTAAMLIDAEMVEFLGSDLHTAKHLSYLQRGLENEGVYKLVKSGRLLNHTLLS